MGVGGGVSRKLSEKDCTIDEGEDNESEEVDGEGTGYGDGGYLGECLFHVVNGNAPPRITKIVRKQPVVRGRFLQTYGDNHAESVQEIRVLAAKPKS